MWWDILAILFLNDGVRRSLLWRQARADSIELRQSYDWLRGQIHFLGACSWGLSA